MNVNHTPLEILMLVIPVKIKRNPTVYIYSCLLHF